MVIRSRFAVIFVQVRRGSCPPKLLRLATRSVPRVARLSKPAAKWGAAFETAPSPTDDSEQSPRSVTISTASIPAPPPASRVSRRKRRNILPFWLRSLPFVSVHLACLAIFLTGVGTVDLLLCAGFYFVRMFGITAGYHRYFSHRTYKTSRAFQFVLAALGCSALQKGPLWWSAHHRHHHKYSDTAEDVHSPISGGFWWSHLGWILSSDYDATNYRVVRDWTRYPELLWLNRNHWIPGILLAVVCWLIGGWSGLVVGFFVSTVLLYHGVFTVNSLCHVFGKRRYETSDKSRNNLFVALITLGEGWHNNHHHYQSSANQGFFWWEIDVSYYIIRGLECCGLVWDVRTPPENKRSPKGQIAVAVPSPPGEPVPCPESGT
ncbi:MAG: acyl-CoA desaturase [Gemmataceae bacterium]|nr:acyl-CoA desaturase [Gemmataceae bacterium]